MTGRLPANLGGARVAGLIWRRRTVSCTRGLPDSFANAVFRRLSVLRSCNFRRCAVRFGLIGKFEVFFDDLRLFRPIKFKGLLATNNAPKARCPSLVITLSHKIRRDQQQIPALQASTSSAVFPVQRYSEQVKGRIVAERLTSFKLGFESCSAKRSRVRGESG